MLLTMGRTTRRTSGGEPRATHTGPYHTENRGGTSYSHWAVPHGERLLEAPVVAGLPGHVGGGDGWQDVDVARSVGAGACGRNQKQQEEYFWCICFGAMRRHVTLPPPLPSCVLTQRVCKHLMLEERLILIVMIKGVG